MIIKTIQQCISVGTVIPKPAARADFVVTGWGTRRGERALIYLIPNHKNPKKPYEKGVTESEFARTDEHLVSEGLLTQAWFQETFPACAREGSCNFTTIGGIFELLGKAKYAEPGLYKSNRQASLAIEAKGKCVEVDDE